jgi:hypothetical protein
MQGFQSIKIVVEFASPRLDISNILSFLEEFFIDEWQTLTCTLKYFGRFKAR